MAENQALIDARGSLGRGPQMEEEADRPALLRTNLPLLPVVDTEQACRWCVGLMV
eukprot:COSAG02_NODE_5579_length_4215_cov_4.280369_5_plen_55_part_00